MFACQCNLFQHFIIFALLSVPVVAAAKKQQIGCVAERQPRFVVVHIYSANVLRVLQCQYVGTMQKEFENYIPCLLKNGKCIANMIFGASMSRGSLWLWNLLLYIPTCVVAPHSIII